MSNRKLTVKFKRSELRMVTDSNPAPAKTLVALLYASLYKNLNIYNIYFTRNIFKQMLIIFLLLYTTNLSTCFIFKRYSYPTQKCDQWQFNAPALPLPYLPPLLITWRRSKKHVLHNEVTTSSKY